MEGNIRSALARQAIEKTFNKEQCINDIKSFDAGVSKTWSNNFINFLENNVKTENYFKSLCFNAMTNKKGNYTNIPIIKYWTK